MVAQGRGRPVVPRGEAAQRPRGPGVAILPGIVPRGERAQRPKGPGVAHILGIRFRLKGYLRES